MSFLVEIKRSAEREMERLPSNVHRRVSRKILSLEENPYPRGSQRLKAGEGYRLRVGDYRILYTVDTRNRIVLIYSVAHRSEAYRI